MSERPACAELRLYATLPTRMVFDPDTPFFAIEEKRKKLPAERTRVAQAFQDAFDLVGGVPRLALYADAHYRDFVKHYSKMIPRGVDLNVSGNITIRPALPPSPLDGEFTDADPGYSDARDGQRAPSSGAEALPQREGDAPHLPGSQSGNGGHTPGLYPTLRVIARDGVVAEAARHASSGLRQGDHSGVERPETAERNDRELDSSGSAPVCEDTEGSEGPPDGQV